MTPGTESLEVSEAAISRLRQSAAERERLERVLLSLPDALRDHDWHKAVEVFGAGACELAAASVAVVFAPPFIEEPLVLLEDERRFSSTVALPVIADLAAVFDDEIVYLRDAPQQIATADGVEVRITLDDRLVRSVLALPVRGRIGGHVGALFLGHHRLDAFSERQIALAAAFAAHLSQALEVTAALNEQSRIANALQTSLLPPVLPVIPGLELAACYRPSGHGNLVGGDFYDIFPQRAGGWNLLLGDASGVGPEAAGLAGIARYTARALVEGESSPSEILHQLNRALLRVATEGRFCTAAIAHFMPDKGGAFVTLASAGHPSPYVLRSSGAVATATRSTGLILGVAEESRVSEVTLHLRSGDALVLYTDGMPESRNRAGGLFGDDGIVSVLRSSTGRSAEGIARRLERAVLDHRDGLNTDDIAILVARVKPA